MRKIKDKIILSIFFTTLILASIFSSRTYIVSAFSIAEDWAEENDDFWTAYEIGPGYYQDLCQGDEDWFNISIGANEIIEIYLGFNGSIDNIDLELFDSGYNPLTSSYETGNYESVLWASMTPQTLYIRIFGYDNDEAYNMNILFDDWAEPNDFLVDSYELGLGYFSGLVQNDIDWFKVWLESDDPLEIDLYYETENNWIGLEMYDENENFLYNEYFVEGDHLHVSWTNVDNSKYFYLKIIGFDNGDLYDIYLKLNDDPGDDYAEENDDFSAARELHYGYYSDMVQNDDDWYKVWLESKEFLEINLFYDPEYEWMNLELFNENENYIAGGISMEGSHLHLDWTNDNSGKFVYFKVTGDNSEGWYDIEIKIEISDDSSNTDPFAAIDLSSIPGFPIEIVGTASIMSTFAVIFFIKKKKH